jgi:hypothetical protein
VLAEQALIAWDPQTRVEHFVRRASFYSDAADFGFLVPTPAPPELAEAPDAVFVALNMAIQPEVVRRTGWRLEPTILVLYPFFLRMRAGAPESPRMIGATAPVRVLEEKRVAGYDAAVLQADDVPGLLRWLKEHNYASRPDLQEWLKPYVEKRWTITAFKVAGVATQAVRMSFGTERPFFPYREPADQRQGPTQPRELLVYLIALGRMEGTIGADQFWSRELLYAAPKDGLGALLAATLPSTAVTSGSWLNAFRDRASPRPGVDDLFFAPATSREKVVPPPVTIDERLDLPLPLDVLAGLLCAGIWWRWHSRARAA